MSKYGELPDRINAYLSIGGVFNPELANHDYVRDLLIDCLTAQRELEAENEELDRKNYKLDSYNTELKAERDGLRGLLKDAEDVLDPDTDMALVMEIRAALEGSDE